MGVDDIFIGYELYDPQLEIDLAQSIKTWLDRRELSKLFFYLYRIDVNEDKIKKILDNTSLNEEKSLEIARLMIKRQIEKLQNRS